jgi:hypothetical protein
MAENQQGATARGTNNKKSGNRKKAQPRTASQNAATPEDAAATAKKPAGRKKGAPKRTSKKAAARRQISAEERYRMIQEAAYFRAEKEGFDCDPWKCWLVAEAEIDAQLAGPPR